jgi:hypothetical protein
MFNDIDRLRASARWAFRASTGGVMVAVEDGTLTRGGLAFSFGYCFDGNYITVLDGTAGTLPNNGTYGQTARRKNELTAEHGMPTHVIQALHPELLDDGDTQWEGNAFDPTTKLAVSCSAGTGRIDRGFAEAGLNLWLAHLGNENAGLVIIARAAKSGSIGEARGAVVQVRV